ncbi:acyl-CoA dehydrogenase family protein [Actinomadura livida]|uniref:Acyl-CoA dehydrogenase family protein n=1 Tax=Actinomadura livida TaxID=79909 RepID=A0A7W7MXL4_9ACTN|nr:MULTISPECIES: acyl-CoA dehydrogenase family protein [Actinomadura]MBB4774818.1 alkylation response protein AidB-like acyl-CoA dehydrogenase [Actinomadura catellatispora]GGU05803.1 acyl-CoA dehydrogenase [Actinomadura livida]
MDVEMDERAEELRARLRAILRELLPDDWAGPFSEDPRARLVTRRVIDRLVAERLLTIDWPEEYGGAGATLWESAVLREEMWAHLEPRGAQYMGLSWVGPTIMEFGTEPQKAGHLRPIAAGEVVWCQGFSEPEAGSDLGSLSLPAVPDGDGWLVRGQKIWTSYATLADWCFLAARTTARESSKTGGVTIFLVPMDRAGISVRPIASIMGPQHLNEVFFDDVRVTREDVLGEVDDGWAVIRFVLGHERIGIPRYARDERLLAELGAVEATASGGLGEDFVTALVHARTARLLNHRAIARREAGGLTDRIASGARIASIELDQEVAGLALDALGAPGLRPNGDGVLGHAEDVYRYARSATIASGTIEIQRMLVARSLMQDAS